MLNEYMNIRVNASIKKNFIDKCQNKNIPYQEMIRRMMEAFNEDKLTIHKPNPLEGLYNDN